MFWDSILEGFSILGYWQVWVALIVYLFITTVFAILTGLAVGEDETGARAASGCLFYIIGGTLLQGVLMGVLIAYLLPILLGEENATPLSSIIPFLWPLAKASIIAFIAVTLLTFFPIIGGIIAQSPGIQSFLEGVIIFRFFSYEIIDKYIQDTSIINNVYPGFWESIGYIIIAGSLVWGIMILVALVLQEIEDRFIVNTEGIAFFVVPMVSIFSGMLPLFMYASYVQLSVKQLLGG